MRQRFSNLARNEASSDHGSDAEALAVTAKVARSGHGIDPSPHDLSSQGNVRVLRLWRRMRTQIDVHVQTGAVWQAGVICDISQFGAGLTGPFTFARKDPITLRLADGRQVRAQVRWRIGNRSGLSFVDRLESTDPLISGETSLSQNTLRESSVTLAGSAAQVPSTAPGFHTLSQVALLLQTAFGWLGGALDRHNKRSRLQYARSQKAKDLRMFRRACREQGFSWLADDESEISNTDLLDLDR